MTEVIKEETGCQNLTWIHNPLCFYPIDGGYPIDGSAKSMQSLRMTDKSSASSLIEKIIELGGNGARCAIGLAGTGRSDDLAIVLMSAHCDTPAIQKMLLERFGNLFIIINQVPDGSPPNLDKVIGIGPRVADALIPDIADKSGLFLAKDHSTLSQALDKVLNAMLLGERPVLGARIHCFVPMQFGVHGKSIEENSKSYARLRRALLDAALCGNCGIVREMSQSGRHYFLPHTHSLLISGATDPRAKQAQLDEQVLTIVAHKAGDDIDAAKIIVTREKPTRTITGCVESVRLHLYTERTVALEYTLAFPAMEPQCGLTAGKTLWGDILLAGTEGAKRSVAAWLDFAEGARHIYSGFEADGTSEPSKAFTTQLSGSGREVAKLDAWKCQPQALDDVRLPIEFHLKYFLEQFLTPLAGRVPGYDVLGDLSSLFEVRCDDRARVVQSVALSGEYPANELTKKRLEVLEARLAMVDEFSETFFYEEAFANHETDRVAYNRFRTNTDGGGNRYFAYDHAFSHLGFGGFAYNPIHTEHMPSLYRRMALLLHLNGAVLNGMLREISMTLKSWDAAKGADDQLTDSLAQLERRFLKFLNLNWYQQVSSQVQGIELFDLMRATSTAARDLNLVDEQITRTSAYLTNRREQRKEANSRFVSLLFTIAASLIALPSLFKNDFWPTVSNGIDALFHAGVADRWSNELAGLCAIWIVAALDHIGLLGTPIRRETNRKGLARIPPMMIPLGMATILPFLPRMVYLPAPALLCALWIGTSIAAMLVTFCWCWSHTTRVARSDDYMVTPLGWLYGGLLAAFMLLTGLHSTGLVG